VVPQRGKKRGEATRAVGKGKKEKSPFCLRSIPVEVGGKRHCRFLAKGKEKKGILYCGIGWKKRRKGRALPAPCFRKKNWGKRPGKGCRTARRKKGKRSFWRERFKVHPKEKGERSSAPHLAERGGFRGGGFLFRGRSRGKERGEGNRWPQRGGKKKKVILGRFPRSSSVAGRRKKKKLGMLSCSYVEEKSNFPLKTGKEKKMGGILIACEKEKKKGRGEIFR